MGLPGVQLDRAVEQRLYRPERLLGVLDSEQRAGRALGGRDAIRDARRVCGVHRRDDARVLRPGPFHRRCPSSPDYNPLHRAAPEPISATFDRSVVVESEIPKRQSIISEQRRNRSASRPRARHTTSRGPGRGRGGPGDGRARAGRPVASRPNDQPCRRGRCRSALYTVRAGRAGARRRTRSHARGEAHSACTGRHVPTPDADRARPPPYRTGAGRAGGDSRGSPALDRRSAACHGCRDRGAGRGAVRRLGDDGAARPARARASRARPSDPRRRGAPNRRRARGFLRPPPEDRHEGEAAAGRRSRRAAEAARDDLPRLLDDQLLRRARDDRDRPRRDGARRTACRS